MDRKSLIGFIVIAALLTVWMTIRSRNNANEAVQKLQQDSIARVDSINMANAAADARRKADSLKALAAADTTHRLNLDSVSRAERIKTYGSFSQSVKGDSTPLTLENEKIKISIYPLGGRIGQVELKGVKTSAGKPLILFHPDSTRFGLAFFDTQRRLFDTDSLYFRPEGKSVSVQGNDSGSIAMRLYADSSKDTYIEFKYTLRGNSYMPSCVITFSGCNKLFADDRSTVDLNWSMVTPSQEKTVKNQRMIATVFYNFDGEETVENLSEHSDESKKITGELKWVSFKQQFFSSILVADSKFANEGVVAVRTPSDPDMVKSMTATVPVPFGRTAKESFPMHFYFGPNKFSELKSHNLHFERQINLGSWIFGGMNRYIFIPLFGWLSSNIANYGLVILLLTVIVKIVLFPVAYKSYLSSAKMRVLKPEIDELGAKFKDDPMGKQKATMALYKKAGANPASGCVPLLLQFPILIALIRLFPAAYELRQQSFLWAHDLSTYDSIWDFGFNIPGYGDHMSLFALLMTISTLLYTWMNQQMLSPGNTQLPGMKWLMYIMPLFFLSFLNSYSAALSYYYFLSNIITFTQMFIMRRFIDEKAIHAKIQANKQKPSSQKSGWLQRMEQAQRKRLEQMQQQQKGGKGKKK